MSRHGESRPSRRLNISFNSFTDLPTELLEFDAIHDQVHISTSPEPECIR